MTREELEHIIRAAGNLLGEDTVIVIGSQSILATFPYDAIPPAATRSLEADVLPLEDPDGAKADLIDEVLGELSRFDETFGIHADGVDETTAALPDGWRDRLVPYTNVNTNGVTGLCLEPHDVCAAKIVALRDKDRQFVRALVGAGLVDPAIIRQRMQTTTIPSSTAAAVWAFIDALDPRRSGTD